MTNPTIKELTRKGIIVKIDGVSQLKANCQKCQGSWLMRFNRVAKVCSLCKCYEWWEQPQKPGPKKK